MSELGFDYYTLGDDLFDSNGNMINPTFKKLAYHISMHEIGKVTSTKGNYIGTTDEGTMIYLIYNNKSEEPFDFEKLKSMDKKTRKIVYAELCSISKRKLDQWNCIFKQIPYDVF